MHCTITLSDAVQIFIGCSNKLLASTIHIYLHKTHMTSLLDNNEFDNKYCDFDIFKLSGKYFHNIYK